LPADFIFDREDANARP